MIFFSYLKPYFLCLRKGVYLFQLNYTTVLYFLSWISEKCWFAFDATTQTQELQSDRNSILF